MSSSAWPCRSPCESWCLAYNAVWQVSQVARKSSEATLAGLGSQPHSHSRIRDPEPLPREVPPSRPIPTEHGRGMGAGWGSRWCGTRATAVADPAGEVAHSMPDGRVDHRPFVGRVRRRWLEPPAESNRRPTDYE